MLCDHLKTVVVTTHSTLDVCKDWLLVIFNLLLQPDWSPVCIWKESSPTRVQGSQERTLGWFEQAANFQCVQQSMCSTVGGLGNISPLIAIEKYSGTRKGEIQAYFYDDCRNIPDPSALGPAQKNLLLLDDCFLCKQNKAEEIGL